MINIHDCLSESEYRNYWDRIMHRYLADLLTFHLLVNIDTINLLVKKGDGEMVMPTHIVACGGLVEDQAGNILIVKTHHGGWVFPGGQVEVGENLMDGVIREVKEESGIDIEVTGLIGIYSNSGIYKWHDGVTDVPTKLMLDFACKPIGGKLCTSDETTDSRWIRKEEVLDYITSPPIRTRFQAYLDFNGHVNYMEYRTHPEFKMKLSRKV